MHEAVCQPPQEGGWAVDPPVKATPWWLKGREKGGGRRESE